MSDTAPIERATGLSWSTIAAAFDDAGGASLTHAELARSVEPLFAGRVENSGWWAQGATVAYEQSIGRRVAGQSSEGDFQVAASRTLPGAAEELALPCRRRGRGGRPHRRPDRGLERKEVGHRQAALLENRAGRGGEAGGVRGAEGDRSVPRYAHGDQARLPGPAEAARADLKAVVAALA